VIYGCAETLGRFLATLIDCLNPERLVIGSIYARRENLFRPRIEEIIREECLPVTGCVKNPLP